MNAISQSPSTQNPNQLKVLENPMAKSETCIITLETHLNGNFKTENDLRLDGTLKGDAHISKKMIIGKEAHMVGNLFANHAFIDGKLEGRAEVQGKLILGPNAHVEGDIFAGSIDIQEGARLNGKMNIGTQMRIPAANY